MTTPRLAKRARLPLRWLGAKRVRSLSKLFLPLGKRVVVIGARIEGAETAEFLIKRGRDVTIVDSAESFGDGMPQRLLMRLRAWLAEKGTPIHLGAEVEEITDAGVRIRTAEDEVLMIPADDVVAAAPQGPNTTAAESFAGVAAEVQVVGPENTDDPWLIVDAVAGGFRVGSSI
jgi:pyruvate/2-oxoglutarate dehydrogenase complex dihydrolipoamide dehydrogenase (E3) component